MKKGIFTLLLLIAVQLGFSQTTYYWVGGTTATSFTSAANWNSQLGGGGTPLAASITGTNSTGFTFIFNGSNLGAAATGPVDIAFTGTINIGQLILENGAEVTLSRSGSSGTVQITIYGLAGTDLLLQPFTKLSLGGTIGNMFVVLGNGNGTDVTAEIFGAMVLKEGTSSPNNNRFTSRTTNAWLFKNGSSLTTEAAYNTYPFGTTGSSVLPANYGVVFESGSRFFYNGGLSPFGSNTISTLVRFLPGSKMHFRAANATNMFSAKVYGDVIVENNATVTANGSLYRMDSLRIENGATYIADSAGVTPIAGNMLVNGTYQLIATNPSRYHRVVMIGSGQQNISGSGTITLGRFIVGNISNTVLNKSIQVDTSTTVFGTLNRNGNSLTGPGTLTIKAPASVNVTGTLDTFVVRSVADMTGIEIGMSVSGAGIQPNTVVTNVSTANGTFNISLASTAFTAGTALTVFNGQATVLPIKFGNITASLVNGETKINWNILLEENISRYIIERSANAVQFTEVGSVTATRSAAYQFTDFYTAAGVNYYRIKAVGIDGEAKYSSVLKVNNSKGATELSVYPNPVKGNTLNVQLTNAPKGTYSLNLFNEAGQRVYTTQMTIAGGSINQTIALPARVKAGSYSLTVTGDASTLQQRIVVQ